MTVSAFVTMDGCRLVYEDTGQGMPVLWQHGLGADRTQSAEVFPASPGIRRITLECRGHGGSGLGEQDALSIEQFALDAIALLDRLGIPAAVVGGISLGAAVAMRLAALYPERVVGLVMARPAWVAGAAPAGLALYGDVAALLGQYGPIQGAERFNALEGLRQMAASSPDNAASLRGLFQRDLVSTIALLSRIPRQGPGVGIELIRDIACPTLVIANGEDLMHPLGLARTLHNLVRGSQWRIITSRSISRVAHVGEFRLTLQVFLESLRDNTASRRQGRSRLTGH